MLQTYNGTDTLIFIRFSYLTKDKNGNSFLRNTNWYEMENITTISLSSTITTIPIRTGGHTRPLSYVTGFRTCAGTMVFNDDIKFHPLELPMNDLIGKEDYTVSLNAEELYYDLLPPADIMLVSIPEDVGKSLLPTPELGEIPEWYINAVLKMNCKVHTIFGVKFRDIGVTFSIHDLYTEKSMTYIAEQFVPDLKNLDSWKESFTWYNEVRTNVGTYFFDKLINKITNKEIDIASLNSYFIDRGWK